MPPLEIRLDKQGNCPHYATACEVSAPCCGVFVPCRICHDEVLALRGDCATEKMDRFAVRRVRCKGCRAEQPPAAACGQCGITFAAYYCDICHLWQDKKQSIFHCDDCGICRIGTRDAFEHCPTCGTCMAKNNHTCKQVRRDDVCAVCLETIFDSRKGIAQLKCQHFLHPRCLRKLHATGIVNCPVCTTPFVADIPEIISEIDRMNEEERGRSEEIFQGAKVDISCFACRAKSTQVPMALYGLKCQACGSYNTCQI